RLQVPHIDVARPAFEENENASLRRSRTRRPRLGLKLEQPRQAQPADEPRGPDAQRMPTRNTVAVLSRTIAKWNEHLGVLPRHRHFMRPIPCSPVLPSVSTFRMRPGYRPRR